MIQTYYIFLYNQDYYFNFRYTNKIRALLWLKVIHSYIILLAAIFCTQAKA